MKIKKILCFLLAAVLVIEGGEGLVSRKAEAAINYTGSYYKHKKTKKYEEECGISMKKKSAYKGKMEWSRGIRRLKILLNCLPESQIWHMVTISGRKSR